MQHPRLKHLPPGLVAVSLVALALPEGSFPPTAVAALGLLLWSAVLLGLATGLLPRAQPSRAAVAAGLALLGYGALTVLSALWASDYGGVFEDGIRALAYLGAFVFVLVASPPGSGRAWLGGIATGLVGVGAIALLARFEPAPFGSPDADLVAQLPAYVGRLTYPVGYWNGLAALMAASCALLTWFGGHGASRLVRSLATGAIPIAALALWMTSSRGGLVAAGLALALLIAVGSRRPPMLASAAVGAVGGIALILLAEARPELLNAPTAPEAAAQGDAMLVLTVIVAGATALARAALDRPISALRVPTPAWRLGLAALVAIVVAAALAVDPVEQFEQFKEPPSVEELSDGDVGLLRGGGTGRWQYWEVAVEAFAESPAAGVGASDYTPYWLEHRDHPLVVKRAHSLFLETLAELGLAGFALLSGFLAIVGVVGVRRLRGAGASEAAPALAVFLVGVLAAAVDWTWDIPAVFLPTVLAAAILVGPATEPRGSTEQRNVFGELRSRRRFAAGVGVLLLAWVAICASGLALLSERALTASEERAESGDLDGAIEAANEAVDLQPWAAAPRAQLATALAGAGRLSEARAALEQAIDRDDRDWELYALAARLAAEDDDEDAVYSNLARAEALNPLDDEAR